MGVGKGIAAMVFDDAAGFGVGDVASVFENSFSFWAVSVRCFVGAEWSGDVVRGDRGFGRI